MVLIARALRMAMMAFGLIMLAANTEAASLSGCFKRHYDAQHLAAHPGQTVRNIILTSKPMTGNAPWVASATLEIAIVGYKGLASVSGDCTKDGDALNCAGDCDTGAFRVVSRAQGNILLTITDRLLLQRNGCDDESYIDQKPDKQNTQFLLTPASASTSK
jgi:hypothetical protein